MSTHLKLSDGSFSLVDEGDLKWCLSLGVWRPHPRGYVTGPKNVLLHRALLEAPRGLEVDHINGDRRDNRRANLRIATKTENRRNQGQRIDNTSGVKGVSWDKTRGLWLVLIKAEGRRINLGRFATLDLAEPPG